MSCFSTARYDQAHIQRVSTINARHDASLERERVHYAGLLAELARRRALAVPVDADGAPIHRVDRRDGVVACRIMCGAKPGDPIDPVRARTARCLRDVCLPAYIDALVKTYAHADIARVAIQLSISSDSDLESLLARANNQALLADIDRQSALLARHHALARSRIEQLREHDLRASTLQRDTEIAAGRAARRARVKAAADAFAAEARGQPAAPATASRATASDPAGAVRPPACADRSRQPSEADTPDPHSPHSIDCIDQHDCPSGMSCDLNTGVCCTTIVR